MKVKHPIAYLRSKKKMMLKKIFIMLSVTALCFFIPCTVLANAPEEEDLYVMAHALAGESQNCSDEEQRYVGSVILNRVAHPAFPDSIKEVVFQKGQYACTRDGNYDREPTEQNWENARWLLENGSILPENVIWQSRRKQGRGVYLKTSKHYYCY